MVYFAAMKAVILAAGIGSRLRPLTDRTPKALLEVGGRPILDHTLEALWRNGVQEAVVVTGHLSGQVEDHVARSELPCRLIFNPRFDTANNYYSLLVAEEALGGEPFVKVDADLVFQPGVLTRLLSTEGDLCLAVDTDVSLGAEEMKLQVDAAGQVRAVSKNLEPATCAGESIGLERISAAFSPALFDELRAIDREGFVGAYYEDAYDRLARQGIHDIRAVEVSGLAWAEIDDARDLAEANRLFGG